MQEGLGFQVFPDDPIGGSLSDSGDEECEIEGCDGVAERHSLFFVAYAWLCEGHAQELNYLTLMDDDVKMQVGARMAYMHATRHAEWSPDMVSESYMTFAVLSRPVLRKLWAYLGRDVPVATLSGPAR